MALGPNRLDYAPASPRGQQHAIILISLSIFAAIAAILLLGLFVSVRPVPTPPLSPRVITVTARTPAAPATVPLAPDP